MKTFTLTEDDAHKLDAILDDCRGVAYYDSLVRSYFTGGNPMTKDDAEFQEYLDEITEAAAGFAVRNFVPQSVNDELTRCREFLQVANDMADDHLAAANLPRAHAATLTGRINRARHVGHFALGNPEGAHVAALADAVAEMLQILEGDK